MPRLSFIILVARLAVAHGIEEQADACGGMGDETCLLQTNIAYHNRHKTEMHQVLADLEEVALATPEGPVVLQELLDGVMALPALKTEEAMRAAVLAQPQLQHLGERYPHLLRALAMFEDPQKTEQIKAAVFQSHPSLMKMLGQGWQGRQLSSVAPARRMPGDAGLLAFSQDQSAIMVWLEGYGCSTKISYTDFPEGKLPIAGVPVFGPDCTGWPNVKDLVVDPAAEGGYLMFTNWSSTSSKNKNTVQFVGEDGAKELGSWMSSWFSAHTFNVAADAYVYIEQNGSWPNYNYQLMSASLPKVQVTTLLSNVTGCSYPSYLTTVPGTKDMIWTCSKDYQVQNDTYKIMKYSWRAKTTEVLTHTTKWFGNLAATESHVYYSQSENKPDGSYGYAMYGCTMASCIPERVGDLASSNFILTESGEVITSAFDASWKKDPSSGPTTYWSTYNVTSTDVSRNASKVLFTITGYPKDLQIVVNKPGPEDILAGQSGGPPGPPGPAGPPGPPGQ